MTSFLVDKLAKVLYTVKYIHGRPLWQASITAHRHPSTQNIGVRSVAYLGTLRTEPLESEIKFSGVRSIQRVHRLQQHQWGSMASMTSKRLKGVKEIQRCSKRFKEPETEITGFEERCSGFNKDKNGEIGGGVAEMQHSYFLALQHVPGRHSVTQHLVAKKTNNFNGLTAKNRLTAVVVH